MSHTGRDTTHTKGHQSDVYGCVGSIIIPPVLLGGMYLSDMSLDGGDTHSTTQLDTFSVTFRRPNLHGPEVAVWIMSQFELSRSSFLFDSSLDKHT